MIFSLLDKRIVCNRCYYLSSWLSAGQSFGQQANKLIVLIVF